MTVCILRGLAFGLAFGVTYGTPFGLVGIAIPIASELSRTPWAHFERARIYLVTRRKVPWDLMMFLEDAHQHRGVLRQVGAVYQFRHIDLQRHLAQ